MLKHTCTRLSRFHMSPNAIFLHLNYVFRAHLKEKHFCWRQHFRQISLVNKNCVTNTCSKVMHRLPHWPKAGTGLPPPLSSHPPPTCRLLSTSFYSLRRVASNGSLRPTLRIGGGSTHGRKYAKDAYGASYSYSSTQPPVTWYCI